MPTVGTLTFGAKTLNFVIARTSDGFVSELVQSVTEEMTSPGVDGRRWRTLYDQFPTFTMETVSDATAYADAIQYHNRAQSFKNELCKMTLTIAGTNYTWSDVHVNDVSSAAVAAPVVYSGSASGVAHMLARWELVMTSMDQKIKAGT